MGPEAGWYQDGVDSSVERWWDGSSWSTLTRAIDAPPEPVPPTAAIDAPVSAAPPAASVGVPGSESPTGRFEAVPGGLGDEATIRPTATTRGSNNRLAVVLAVLVVAALGVVVGVFVGKRDQNVTASEGAADRNGVALTSAPEPTSVPTSEPTTIVTTTTTVATTIATTTQPLRRTGPTEQLFAAGWTASSTRADADLFCEPGRTMSYGVGRAFDDDTETAWAPTYGRNAGEWVRAEFSPAAEIRQIKLYNGYLRYARRKAVGCSPASSYDFNRHITEISIEFDDGYSERFRLSDTTSLQVVDLASPRVSSSVTIRILDTELPPGADDDTLITDIYFEGSA